MTLFKCYKIKSRQIVPCSPVEWAMDQMTGKFRVAETRLDTGRLSTVFIGYGTTPIFETAFFSKDGEVHVLSRWASWDEAELGHYKLQSIATTEGLKV